MVQIIAKMVTLYCKKVVENRLNFVTFLIGAIFSVNGVNTTVGVIRIGVYHRHLANWLQRFPLRQIHVIDGEALVGDPAPVLRGVERFLGLEPGFGIYLFGGPQLFHF